MVDALLIAGCAAVAALLKQDANWDQLQYHYWYPWQLFHGGFTDPDLYGGRFQNPLPQVPFYLLTSLHPVAAQAAALHPHVEVGATIREQKIPVSVRRGSCAG